MAAEYVELAKEALELAGTAGITAGASEAAKSIAKGFWTLMRSRFQGKVAAEQLPAEEAEPTAEQMQALLPFLQVELANDAELAAQVRKIVEQLQPEAEASPQWKQTIRDSGTGYQIDLRGNKGTINFGGQPPET